MTLVEEIRGEEDCGGMVFILRKSMVFCGKIVFHIYLFNVLHNFVKRIEVIPFTLWNEVYC